MTAHELSYATPGQRIVSPPALKFPLYLIAVTAVIFVALLFFVPPTLPRLMALFLLPAVVGVVLLGWWVTRRGVLPIWRGMGAIGVMALLLVGALLGEKLTRMFVLLWGVPTSMAVAILVAAFRGPKRVARPMIFFLVIAAVAFVPWLLIRTNGQQGEGMISFTWRWTSSREQRLNQWVKVGAATRSVVAADELVPTASDWPSFRGPDRNSIVTGVSMKIGGSAEMNPKLLWRHPVGTGWSSFAVVGNCAFTQEQRFHKEFVCCYDIRDGKEIWAHSDDTEFNEMSGGEGPRATPAVSGGRVYSFGPTGILNCLDAGSGKVIWKATTYVKAYDFPRWGYASSPLVENGKVIIAPSGGGGAKLAAFDAATGALVWAAFGGKEGYSSPVIGTLGGVRQVAYIDGDGVSGHSLADGARLWAFPWESREPKVATPVFIDDSTLLVGMGYGRGLKLLTMSHAGNQWSVTEKWHTGSLKPKFNDLVVSNGYVYGLDEGHLACVRLADGARTWRGEAYGYGQILVVGSHLLVAAESGEVAIVEANPEAFRELGRFQAIEGKSWTHPVLVRGKLLVRNADEAACYDLSPWLR